MSKLILDLKDRRAIDDALDGKNMRKVLQQFDRELYYKIVSAQDFDDTDLDNVLHIYVDIRSLFKYICQDNGVYIYNDGA